MFQFEDQYAFEKNYPSFENFSNPFTISRSNQGVSPYISWNSSQSIYFLLIRMARSDN